MPFKEKDFVELDYTGFIKDTKDVFDTTDAATAKEHHLSGSTPGKVVICLGRGYLMAGLEKRLIGREPGNHRVELSAQDAFGKKNAKLLVLIPTQNFIRDGVQPQPGLPVEIDGKMGRVKAVTGGRTIVDFNHPLSGRDVYYDVTVHKVVTDAKEKVAAVVRMLLKLEAQVTVDKDDATVSFKQELPKELVEFLGKEIQETTGMKHVHVIKA